jgi:hypothetical protein
MGSLRSSCYLYLHFIAAHGILSANLTTRTDKATRPISSFMFSLITGSHG